MAEKASEIVRQLESHRERLGEDLDDLQQKVKATVKEKTDWHTHYKQSPYWFLGVAFVGGVLAASIFGKPKSASSVFYAPTPTPPPKASNGASLGIGSELHNVVDDVKAALIGFGIAKLKGALSDMIPGLGPHLEGRRH